MSVTPGAYAQPCPLAAHYPTLIIAFPLQEEWQPSESKELVDAAQMVLNCRPLRRPLTNSKCAATILISRLTDATTILHLLSTALTRGHQEAVKAALKLPALRRLGTADILQYMQADVAARGKPGTTTSFSSGGIMEVLVQLPAASFVARSDIMLMLQTALTTGNAAAVTALCTLSATRTASVQSTIKLLKSAIRSSMDEAVATLCGLPAAKDIDDDDWTVFATAAVDRKLKCGSAELCKLPAARHAAQEIVVNIFSSAVHYKLYAAAVAMVGLPAAKYISSVQAFVLTRELVTQTAKSTNSYCCYDKRAEQHPFLILSKIGKLKAVQNISTTQLLELFSILRQHGKYSPAVDMLSKLPAANSIPAAVMVQQMQEAVRSQDFELLSALCDLPAVTRIDGDTLLQLLDMAKQQHSDIEGGMQEQLCNLAARLQLSSSQLMAFMHATIALEEDCREFEENPVLTSQLSADNVAELLLAAMQQRYSTGSTVKTLCGLAAAKGISSTVLAGIMSAALDRNGSSCQILKRLCSLPAAQQITQDAAAALISKAEQSGEWRNVLAVLPLKPRQSGRLRR